MDNVFVALGGVVVIIGLINYPRRQPDTLAPIQLITLTGATALLLLQLATAIATIYWWMLLPSGLTGEFALLYLIASTLSLLTAGIIFFHSLLRPRRTPSAALDSWLKGEVDALRQLVCGGSGMKNVRLYRGTSTGTEVEAIRTPDGAGIRIGEGLPKKLAEFERHYSGGARRVRALIRFMLLHELGHLINGDHIAYQFARAALLSQLWYLIPLLALLPFLLCIAIWGAPRSEWDALAGLVILLGITTTMVFFQRVIAKRFATARERLADWRATITLAAADRARLLETPPDDCPFLEKAFCALQGRRMPSALAALLTLTWPQAERIDVRVGQLIAGHSQGKHQPWVWSALAGANVGALVVLAISLAGSLANAWAGRTGKDVVLLLAVILATLPAAILVGRADPTDPFSGESSSWGRRVGAGGVYLLAHTAAVTTGYFALYAVPSVSPLQYATAGDVVVLVILMVAGSAFLMGTIIDLGPVTLGVRGELQMRALPFLLGIFVIIPLNLLFASIIGSELKGPYAVLFLPSVTIFFLSTVALQSNYRLIRRLAPLGAHRSSGDVVRVRVLTTDVAADLRDLRRRSLFLRLTFIWTTQMAIGFTVVAIAVLRLLSSASPDEAMAAIFGLGVVMLVVLPFLSAITNPTTPRKRTEQHIDTLHTLFQSQCEGPLRPLLGKLKPSVVEDLRHTPLRDPGRKPSAEDLRRAAQKLELANAVGATVTTSWSEEAGSILQELVTDDVVRSWLGGPPSAYCTAWAARLAAASGDPSSARALAKSAERLLPVHCDSVYAIFVAATAVRLGVTVPALQSAGMHRLLRVTDCLSDLAIIAPAIGSEAVAVLRQTVRSRLWTTLHENSRRQLFVALDIIDAGNRLGEGGTSLWNAAEERLCDLLTADDELLLRRLSSRSPSAHPTSAVQALRS